MAKKQETKGGTGARPNTTKRQRVRVKTGQLAAVPLMDGTCALLHVALYNGRVIGAHYAYRKSKPEQLLAGLDEAMQRGPIAILAVTSDEIYDGHWPVIGHREPQYAAELLDMKGSSYTASATRGLFNAYYGLRPWDEMTYPMWYDKMLLPGVPVPPTVRYKRDFEQAAQAATAATPSTESPQPAVTEGPAEIHIEITYPGDALPSVELVRRRTSLEQALEKAGAGEVTDAGGGGGVMDIYLRTDDVQRALPLVQAAIDASGFGSDTRVEVTALPDSEEDEE